MDNDDMTCVCGLEPQTMEHLLRCPLLEQVCDAKDLAELNGNAED